MSKRRHQTPALLNVPDPKCSIGAMQIMMKSGHAGPVEIASKYGLLSPDPDVQSAALEDNLPRSPRIPATFDGAKGAKRPEIGRDMVEMFTKQGLRQA